MYISFLGGRKPKLKITGAVIALIICVSSLTLIIGNEKNESLFNIIGNYFYEIVGNVTLNLYNHIIANEYNISSCDEVLDGEIKSEYVKDKIKDIVNKNNNIYEYTLSERAKDIVYTCYDPSYIKSDFVGVSSKDDINVTEEKITEEKTTEEKVIEGNSSYVIPTVAENGIVYDIEKLSDFKYLLSELYIVPSRAKVIESELVATEMLASDMTLKGDNSKPQILIYHTHSQEGFADSVPGDENTTIVGVGAYLAKILSEVYGYNVIHCREKFDIKNGTLDRSKAYTYAEETITQILEDNPTIEVVLDIHRDGLKEDADKLVTNIAGKDTAKIMFFNGVSRSSVTGDIDYLYNRYKKDNLAFSFQLKLKAMECYPTFTRKNYIDAYQYNLHLRPKSVLVEVGAQNNTLLEELNAMEVLAEVLHRVIK